MAITLGNFIAKKTAELINATDAIVLGQCLTAVGWVAGTVPSWVNKKNIVELSMADVANGGIAVNLDGQRVNAALSKTTYRSGGFGQATSLA